MNSSQCSTLVLDGAHMLRRNMYQPNIRDLSSSTGIPTGGIYGFLNSLKHSVYNLHCNSVVVCWEGGHSARRKELLPTYKERDHGDGPVQTDTHGMTDYQYYIHQLQWIEKILEFLAVPQLRVVGKEGDDTLYQCIRLLHGQKLIVSEDRDFMTLLKDDVSLYQPIKKKLVTIGNFKEISGYKTPRHYLFAKAIMGDCSDNIPGIKGVGEGTVQDVLGKIDDPEQLTIPNILSEAAKFNKARYTKIVEAGAKHIQRNLELIDISMENFDNIELLQMAQYLETNRYPNVAMARKLMEKLEFNQDTMNSLVSAMSRMAEFPLLHLVNKDYIQQRMMNNTSLITY